VGRYSGGQNLEDCSGGECLEILDCDFADIDSQTTWGFGGAVYISGYTPVRIDQSTFLGCRVRSGFMPSGACCYLADVSSAIISNSCATLYGQFISLSSDRIKDAASSPLHTCVHDVFEHNLRQLVAAQRESLSSVRIGPSRVRRVWDFGSL
jgi:hypothetical protein